MLDLPWTFLRKVRRTRRERKRLSEINRIGCHAASLRTANPERLREVFSSYETDSLWNSAIRKLTLCHIPDGSGGVNPGDRRALFYLICAFKPRSILEIGTHIGASTVHLAMALHMNRTFGHGGDPGGLATTPTRASMAERPGLVSVDVADVNDAVSKPWLKHGTKHSPVEMARRMGTGHLVEFVVDHSLDYLKKSHDRFDFIFLDGDHGAETVYQEIPSALGALDQGGVILLHDYFPGLRPLWMDGSVVSGPFLAIERLRNEGADFIVYPLGKLPWPTKLRSNVTSLALLVKPEGRGV